MVASAGLQLSLSGKVASRRRRFDSIELSEKIGRLKMEWSGSRKKLPSSSADLRLWIDTDHVDLTITEQCELLGLARSSYDDNPVPESEENLISM
jgi:hypothetical protein